jgi:hypothetical protein
MTQNWKNLAVIALVAFSLANCSKAKTTSANSNAQQHNEDVTNIKSESDNVNTDVNNVMAQISAFGKNSQAQSVSVCGATIDTSGATGPQPYVTLIFDGTTVCPNPSRIRSGSIKIQLVSGSHWSSVGAVAVLTYTNYKVTYPSLNNHSLTFNGNKYLTDVNGINWVTYYLTGAVTATLKERTYNMTVSFDNSAQTSNWNCARLSTWKASNYTTFSATVNGDTTIGGKTIDSWGQTRYGTNFTTQMVQPWQSGTTCGWWYPTSGNYTSVTDSFTVSALLGVNSSGNQVSSGCAYGFKLSWSLTPSGYSGNAVLPYW